MEPKESNFEGLEMEKWNIPMERDQRLDEKNGVICLFMPRVIVIEMSKMAYFLYFVLMKAEN